MLMDKKRTEIIFGLVGATGTNCDLVRDILTEKLSEIGYHTEPIKLSFLIKEHAHGLKLQGDKLKLSLTESTKDKKINSYMTAGNKICDRYKNGATIANLAIKKIKEKRRKHPPQDGNAYILDSLKRSEEVTSLRQTYGTGFYLVGIYSSYEQRKTELAGAIAARYNSQIRDEYYSQAEQLIWRDYHERKKYGQEVSKTYHLSDVFISLDNREKAQERLGRFIELIFGNSFHTPTRDENAMFLAHTAALRSGALARQVGAAIANKSGEVISVGTNDVPSPDGGLYWEEDRDDCRDHKLGWDSNNKHIKIIIDQIIDSLIKNKLAQKDKRRKLEEILKDDTGITKLTEFGRIVHAEMDAITQAARVGISTRDAILYTTLFSCHNCTKHIIASGIKKVIYIEPYPKSLAKELHSDAISIDGNDGKKVSFLPFEGIGPRRYMDLFSLVTSIGITLERKDGADGKIKKWQAKDARPRLPMSANSYMDEELLKIKELKIQDHQGGKNEKKTIKPK